MIEKLILQAEIFIFIFAILIVVRNLFNFLQIIRQREGKFSLATPGLITLGCAISYIITKIITGF